MEIAVYSGSFNPLHIGHKAILEYLSEKAGFDMTYLVVTPHNPFKDAGLGNSGALRYEAAVKALSHYPALKARALDIELKMEAPQYTIRTLDALREAEPGNNFTLVIGADNLAAFDRWKDYGRILREYGVAVFPRKGYHRGHDRARLLKQDPSFRIRLLDAPLVNISSSEIRAAMASGADVSRYLML